MKSLAIPGEVRENTGKKNSKTLRKESNVPCVLYGGNEQVHFSVSEKSLRDLVYTPEAHTVELSLGEATYSAILQDIQYHPVSDKIVHVDFLQLFEDKPVTMKIPVNVHGNSKGVIAGGKLQIKMRSLKVRALPKDLPDSIEVDITEVGLGQSVKVGNVESNGLQLLDSPNAVVCAVKLTRSAMQAMAAAAAEE